MHFCRVNLEIKDIHKHPVEYIEARFLDKSFEIKIRDFNGKNLKFAVPKLQCRINAALCKFDIKENKISVALRKNKKGDNWFSLFKTKTVGGDDSD